MDLDSGTYLTIELSSAGKRFPVEVAYRDSDGEQKYIRLRTNGTSEVTILSGEDGRKVVMITVESTHTATVTATVKKHVVAPPSSETLYDGDLDAKAILMKPPDDGQWQLLSPEWVYGTQRALWQRFIPRYGNMIIENRTDDPATPVSGQIWLREDLV